MKRTGIFLSLLIFSLPLFGFSCNSVATTARDTIATNYGFLTYAQAQFGVSCKANPNQQVCVIVKKDIPLHNALIDALEAFCGGTPAAGVNPFSAGGACVPVSGLQASLQAALNALTPVLNDLKPLINPTTQAAKTNTQTVAPRNDFELLEEHRL